MGRSAGWIAAGTVLAKRAPHEAPHVILLPEIPFDQDTFLRKVKECVDAYRCCVVVVGEGLRNAAGEEIAADKKRLDAFGHPVLSGAAEYISALVGDKLDVKSRSVKLGNAPPPILPAPPMPRKPPPVAKPPSAPPSKARAATW
jgi:6-phosphofructokinase 1